MKQVIQDIKALNRTNNDSLCYSRFSIIIIAPFETEKFVGALFNAYYEFEELGYDGGDGDPMAKNQ